jgi:hypothetical protein
MARTSTRSTVEPVIVPEGGDESGGETLKKIQIDVPAFDPNAVSVAAASPAPPTLEEILAAIGVDNEALRERILTLIGQFPGGIPQQLLFDAINNAVSVNALYLKIGEVYVAAQKFALTGKGPVGHASVELV